MTEKRYKLHHNYHFGYGVEDTYNSDRLYLDEFELLVDELNTLNDENEQLSEENKRLVKMLDNVANYMQKQNNIPIDDFVEWWNNIATRGINE